VRIFHNEAKIVVNLANINFDNILSLSFFFV